MDDVNRTLTPYEEVRFFFFFFDKYDKILFRFEMPQRVADTSDENNRFVKLSDRQLDIGRRGVFLRFRRDNTMVIDERMGSPQS